MDRSKQESIEEIGHSIRRVIAGEVRTDVVSRILYSTDASIYQVEPCGVVFPKTIDDLQAIVETCAAYEAPMIARGSGSGLAGQAIGPGWVIDCSRWLDQVVDIHPEEQTAIVEPGLILNALNKTANQYGLQFGPDPASAERASLGGSLANNAAGAHSICYGMAVDHLLEADVVLADGTLATFGEVDLDTAAQKACADTVEGALYRASLRIRNETGGEIQQRWPRTWRRASGYNLNYLLPWAASAPQQWQKYQEGLPYPPLQAGSINLAHLFAGAEGTLGVFRRMKIRLVRRPEHVVLLVLKYSAIVEACEAIPGILEHDPAAVELIPNNLIQLAASAPAYASLVQVLRPLFDSGKAPPAVLVVELNGSDPLELQERALRLAGSKPHILAERSLEQQKIWGVRKAGLGLFMSRAGDQKPWSFIEDLSVPVENLGKFVREMYRIMGNYGVEGENYGHASAGCLHIRPVLNLKSVKGVEMLRAIARDAVELTLSLGGAVSGEHGDGLARTEWGERMFGVEIMQAFRLLKRSADPHNLLNPGKIIGLDGHSAPKMDQNLRFGPDYRSTAWEPALDFSRQAGLEGAIEQCNGAGVCRKNAGVMCPSFQATKEEIYSTRGRANLLRAMINQAFPRQKVAEQAAKEALDLCLACKGCKAECPSAVDMAKLKVEFFGHYHKTHSRPPGDFLFGYIDVAARISQPFWWIANPVLGSGLFSAMAEKVFGISRDRRLPRLARQSLRANVKRQIGEVSDRKTAHSHHTDRILFLSDPFTEYFYPHVGLAAIHVLELAGCQVTVIPVIGTGRTLISKGFIAAARKQAERMVRAIMQLDPGGECAIVGVEPSEVAMLYDEYVDLLADQIDIVQTISKRSFMIEEYLARLKDDRLEKAIMRIATSSRIKLAKYKIPAKNTDRENTQKTDGATTVFLHGHCYQKAHPPAEDGYPVGVEASRKMLEAAGYHVVLIDSGCCGMAGSFGYEKAHKEVSMKVGELALFPAIRTAGLDVLIAASGASCRAQIQDGTGRPAYHPIELLIRN